MIWLKIKIQFIIIILFMLPVFSSCAARELDSISLVTAVGIDKDGDGYLVTYQVLNPKAIASQKSVYESPIVIYTEKGPDLGQIERRVTTQAARKMYTAHVRAVVLGEDVARDGIREILDYLFRSNEYRTDHYFIIAKGTTAGQILKTVTMIQPVSGIKLYESIENSKKWWSPTNSLRIVELINTINAKGSNPVLAGIELEEQDDIDTVERLKKTDPGEVRYTSLGAFRGDKLVGWLDESESLVLSSLLGKAKNSAGNVRIDKDTLVSLNFKNKKPLIDVYMSDGEPIIDVVLQFEMSITAQTGDIDFTKPENADTLKLMVDEKYEGLCGKLLEKAQKELKTDIFGFGERIHRACPQAWNDLKDNWNDEFSNLQVNFTVDSKLMDLGQNLKPIIKEEG